MIQGARDWYQNGFGKTPEVVVEETKDYFDEQNLVQAWMDECCLVGPNFEDTKAHLFTSFEAWCQRNGQNPGKINGLTSTLKHQYHCKPNRTGKSRKLIGIAVSEQYKPDPRIGEREE